jgi:type II secretory pathway pseudopilin PulG
MLVVIGIISIMISILLPTLSKARAQADKVKCMANMHEIGEGMLIYAEQYHGYLFPPNKGWPTAGAQIIPGTNPPQYDVWPYYVLKQWNSPIMICPADQDPSGQHSYVANAYLMAKTMDNSSPAATASTGSGPQDLQYSSSLPFGHTPADVIVLGEKLNFNPQSGPVNDYYMEPGDFDTKVDQFKHGPLLGSNYLMMDMHVDTLVPAAAKGGIDPWDVNGDPTTQPTSSN